MYLNTLSITQSEIDNLIIPDTETELLITHDLTKIHHFYDFIPEGKITDIYISFRNSWQSNKDYLPNFNNFPKSVERLHLNNMPGILFKNVVLINFGLEIIIQDSLRFLPNNYLDIILRNVKINSIQVFGISKLEDLTREYFTNVNRIVFILETEYNDKIVNEYKLHYHTEIETTESITKFIVYPKNYKHLLTEGIKIKN